MHPDSLATEIILTNPPQYLGKLQLDWAPQPGNYLDFEGKTYAVLERHHRYQFRTGRYRLHRIAIYVQTAKRPSEKSFINGRWVVGDASCKYNAHSEIIRCAVNPDGPCNSCAFNE
ncbi:DUF6464 family protein [Cylindrospermopsis raciborskii]|uniref:Uncharacterized protein n=1 Tax=Cylindrospermopsis raciborskii CENA302 TaxID=1170768 RepID=A0A9Q5QZ25_9CYAN|nr:DUF6464 family protein [Cylindrospermopsis raciborskii]MCZ2201715.1 DUF6464 family protein [Cylindrospermopsis raciborskii PAMP2012]MCZ2204986.1 DUF6464 family protein [Cylindrospermopsis raciborskii PAMP2011]NLQ06451.1 hypothetical protein [Cylindrospermopsis raciborskii MVCC19]OHY32087.1 hypothetical protein BCV64_14160 [Cylindrospermopsis raciborskii MVCC14]OPH10710.1 hypothetical protein CENA302_03450 [Cylindrospermopsis raciborskii CENA302]